jgi:hypothetical protein
MYHRSFGKYKVEIINENNYVIGSADNIMVQLLKCMMIISNSWTGKVFDTSLHIT